MGVLTILSTFMIPLVIFYIVGYGCIQKINLFSTFTKGAMEGFKIVFKIAPTLVGLLAAVGILRASGFLDLLSVVCGDVLGKVGFPSEVMPLAVVRLFSASAATGLLLDLFKEFGVDSYPGLVGAVILSSTETVFYCMSIYYGSIGIKKGRYTLAGALLSTTAGVVASVILCRWMMK